MLGSGIRILGSALSEAQTQLKTEEEENETDRLSAVAWSFFCARLRAAACHDQFESASAHSKRQSSARGEQETRLRFLARSFSNARHDVRTEIHGRGLHAA